MSKMSIADAALRLGISKEAIHNRIRRGSLESLVEDGVKYVLLDKTAQTATKATVKRATTRRSPEPDARYYKLLEEQNEKLQLKVDQLESETKNLRDQKEQMLIQEREKIEQIYKDKDEQLKSILNAISSQFLLNTPTPELTIEKEEVVETVIEAPQEEKRSGLISLKKYLKEQKFLKKKCEKIKSRFKKVAKKDSRVIKVGKKYYLDLAKFDYSNLIK